MQTLFIFVGIVVVVAVSVLAACLSVLALIDQYDRTVERKVSQIVQDRMDLIKRMTYFDAVYDVARAFADSDNQLVFMEKARSSTVYCKNDLQRIALDVNRTKDQTT